VLLFWSQELAKQSDDQKLKAKFEGITGELEASQATILKELIDCQGKPVDLGGYYHVDKVKTDAAMNPSATLNAIIQKIKA